MNKKCTIQIFVNGAWQDAALVGLTGPVELGWQASCYGGYTLDHVITWPDSRDAHACSHTWPVSAEISEWDTWPAFLIDLLPQGFGRQEMLKQLSLKDGPSSDWALLLAGTGNPVGNLRIKEAWNWLQQHSPPRQIGFHFNEVAQRHEDFVEYLANHGLFVAGSSGVQGEWPKILLTEADDGLLYLDHLLPDQRARRHYLVKFTRSGPRDLNLILEAEGKYMACARHLGLRVHALPEYHGNTLFIPRFDRHCESGQVQRIAQESLASLCQRSGFGVRINHNDACAAIANAVTDPQREIIEYLKRDLANIVMGNKDNHSRNTAISRDNNGLIALTPLYDFAPMYLHPDGIARPNRWREHDRGQPDWRSAAEQAADASGVAVEPLIQALKDMAHPLATLETVMREQGLAPDIIQRVSSQAAATAKILEAL
ncbi:capsule biosynthesis protein [Alcanivorax xiamenensis]|uniref:Capsule biosynthesis protein n=2 Tax=Alcanivorax xiamenensis TaxID=1177156 RepID=A0ABQ6YDH1_9GAMM|nr:capsule biosynthesis protein [Alcanivorax xiamenensis]